MITDNQITVHLPAAGTYYAQAPMDCEIQTVRATANGAIGAATVTIKDSTGTYTIGVATWDTGAAGEVATYAANATYGNRDLDKDDVIQIVFALTNAVAGACVQIDLDPYRIS